MTDPYRDSMDPVFDPDIGDPADIGSEHDDLTTGEEDRGGPERTPEPESPDGYGGMEGEAL